MTSIPSDIERMMGLTPPDPPTFAEDTIRYLEALITECRAGRMATISVAFSGPDGQMFWWYRTADARLTPTLLAGLTLAQSRLVQEILQTEKAVKVGESPAVDREVFDGQTDLRAGDGADTEAAP